MDHTARIAWRGMVLTVLDVMQLMASVTLAVVQDGRETFVNKVSILIIEVVHHNLMFVFKSSNLSRIYLVFI